MTLAVTEKYEEMTLSVETSTPGTYAKICGIQDVTIDRKANVDSTEVPDCDSEDLPFTVERDVRSVEVTISGTGVWAQTSQDMLKAWFYSGATKNVRLTDAKAAVGDIEIESGAALLTKLTNSRTKGKRVSAEIELQLAGAVSRTDQT